MLEELLQRHHGATGKTASTVVAYRKYGTIHNLLTCFDKGVKAHMSDLAGWALSAKRNGASSPKQTSDTTRKGTSTSVLRGRN